MATKSPLDRNNEADARRVIESIIPDTAERRSVLSLLAELIERGNRASVRAWGLTLSSNGIRLNVGPIEVFTLRDSVGPHFIIDNGSLSAAERVSLESAGAEIYGPPVYRSVPQSVGVEIPIGGVQQAAGMLLPAALNLVEAAAARRPGQLSWWRAHSPGAIRYIGEFLGRDLPQPSYDAPAEVESAVEIQEIPIEDQNVDSAIVAGSAEPHDAEFRERALMLRYVRYLRARGVGVSRYQIKLPGAGGVIFCDVWDARRRNLLEAKGEITRDSIRMAIGQLADYGRFLEPSRSAVLLPERPSRDLEDLLGSAEIGVVWENADGQFDDNSDGRFI
ncbi:MAG TPA: hypothetical protein VND20_06045 [Candidatus Binataceae bacterium]|nr:hypothetical protein [Candidatus Binataceae bacterium]